MQRYLGLRKGDSRLRPVQNTKELYQGDMFYFTCIGEKKELTEAYRILSQDGVALWLQEHAQF